MRTLSYGQQRYKKSTGLMGRPRVPEQTSGGWLNDFPECWNDCSAGQELETP